MLLNEGAAVQLFTRYRFGFDQSGRITSRVIETADGRDIETSIFRFSGEGLLVSRETKDQNRLRVECVYDVKGRLIRSVASEWLQSGTASLREESFSYWPDRVECAGL